MKKSKFAASLVDKIKNEKIEQHSKLYFFAKFALMLFGGIIFFIIGVIATAVIWHFFHDTELLEIFSIERMLFFRALLLSFPIFWLIMSVLLGISVSYFARNTKKGYKISYKVWFGVILLTQIFAGFALEQSPIGEILENRMTRSLQIMKSREGKFQEVWQNPAKGMLIGEVMEISRGNLVLQDLEDKEWEVNFPREAVRGHRLPKVSDKVRIIGEKVGEFEFSAKKIFGRRFDFKRPELREGIMEKRRENRQNCRQFLPRFKEQR